MYIFLFLKQIEYNEIKIIFKKNINNAGFYKKKS